MERAREAVPGSGSKARRALTIRARSALGLHLGSLLLGISLLLLIDRKQWFFGDEWDFLASRGLFHARRGLFFPHNEHWTTTPILVYRGLFSLFGLRTYLPYLLILLVLHAAVGHMLWRLLLRVGVRASLATALAFSFLLNGAGAEQVTSAFQITFVAPVVLGLAHVLLADHDGAFDRRDIVGIGLTAWGLTFSGIGVPMIMMAGAAVLFRRGWRPALATVAPGAVLYLSWLVLVGSEGLSSHEITARGFLRVPEYTWRGLVAGVENSTPFLGAGAVLLVGLGAYLVGRARRGRRADGPVFAAALGALSLYLIVAPGRVALGVDQSESSRYAYIAWCLLLPGVGLLLEEVVGNDRLRRLVILSVISLGMVRGADLLITAASGSAATEQMLRQRFLAVAAVASPDQAVLSPLPDATTAPDLTVARLLQFRRQGALPTVRPTPESRLLGEGSIGIRFGAALQAPPGPTIEALVGGAPSTGAGAGCLRVGPAAGSPQLALNRGRGTVTVTSSSPGELRVLVGDGRGTTVDPGRVVELEPSKAVEVAFDVPDGLPILLLPTGESVVCGVRPVG